MSSGTPHPPRIQITKLGIVDTPALDVERLRTQFELDHYLRLPNLLEPTLFDELTADINKADFYCQNHDVGSELYLEDNRIHQLLNFVFNNQVLFDFVQSVTGCSFIGCFIGRVYRHSPDESHFDEWHDDMIRDRLVALTLNLSDRRYEGGHLEIREKATGQISELDTSVPGEALLFQLDHALEHRRTPVRGISPRTAFAGWFKSQPSYQSFFVRD